MDFEILVRYLVPGTIALAPLILLPLVGYKGSTDTSGALIAAAIPVGYLLHQVWHLIYHIRGGYVRVGRRKCLQYISRQIEQPVGDACVYWVWEYLLDKVEPEKRIRGQLKRLWQLYHGFMSSLLGSVLGAILLIVTYYPRGGPQGFLCVGLIAYAGVLWTMAAQARFVGVEVSDREGLCAIDAVQTERCTLKRALEVYAEYRSQLSTPRRRTMAPIKSHTPLP